MGNRDITTQPGRHRPVVTAVAIAALLVVMVGCSSTDTAEPGDAPGTTTTASDVGPPEGTTVDVTAFSLADMPPGGGVAQSSATVAIEPAPEPTLADGYREVEYLVHGVANTYSGPATGPAVVASSGTPYVTRLIARFPEQETDFSGRVFLEPFNTTSGPDRDVIWRQVAPLLQGSGDAWVGISVRSTSVEELLKYDASRYTDMSIPTNDLVWDMLRQLGAVLRTGGEQSPLPSFAQHLYMGGYSQSGVDTATFAMAFHDDADVLDGSPLFDGYFPAAHAATTTPLQTGSGLITDFEEGSMQAVDVPVVDFETQHDVQGWTREVLPGTNYTSPGSASVRRDNSNTPTDKYWLFEITGASHSSSGGDCGGAPSTFPGPLFVRAALVQLFEWAEQGTPPTESAVIEMDKVDVVSTPRVDEVGNALGGVRSPFVDVPLVQYQVQAGGSGLACTFSGTETPIPSDTLVARYGNAQAYMDQFTASLDDAIDARYLLADDRATIVDAAETKAETLLPADS